MSTKRIKIENHILASADNVATGMISTEIMGSVLMSTNYIWMAHENGPRGVNLCQIDIAGGDFSDVNYPFTVLGIHSIMKLVGLVLLNSRVI
jgi:hypothetical protein